VNARICPGRAGDAAAILPVTAGTAAPSGGPAVVQCPPAEDPGTIRSYLIEHFGEPVEVAWTGTGRHEAHQRWLVLSGSAGDRQRGAVRAEAPDGSLFEMLAAAPG
jgi:hypothetical protein